MENVYDLLDDELEIEEPQDDLYYEEEPPVTSARRSRRSTGMRLTAFQWFLLSFLFFVGMCTLTIFFLLLTERMILPI